MNIFQRYKKLSFWNKLGVCGSVITIISYISYLLYQQLTIFNSNKIHYISNSDKNIVIQSNRDVVINSPLSLEGTRKDSIKQISTNSPKQIKYLTKDSSKISLGPNSVVSINQQGGQTAKTINNIIINSSDRSIPPNTTSSLIEQLSKYKNKRVVIRIANNDIQSDEPIRFSNELNKIFSDAGWKVSLSNSMNMIANSVVTKGMIVNAINRLNIPIADFLCNNFISLGYNVSSNFYTSSDVRNDLIIEVWTK